jgi:hypothetical protein
MISKTFRKLLLVAYAGLLLVAHGPTPSLGRQTGGTPPAPIELSGVTIEYAISNEVGDIVWVTPAPKTPNVIPSETQRLRFRATVTNRPPGARIRVRAILQEVCTGFDGGKPFLAKLRHLTETDPGNATDDPSDDEEQVIKQDRTISIEIPVHCDACGETSCGKKCRADRDHLGEGPHVVTTTTTDPPPASGGESRAATTGAARPSSFRVEVRSVCPAQRKPSGSRRRGAHPPSVAPRVPVPSAALVKAR